MQELLNHIHQDIIVKFIPLADRIPIHLIYIGGLLAASLLIIIWMSVIAMGWIWAERRVAGFIQSRVGPNRVHFRKGPFKILPTGWLQSLADGIKLIAKEDIIPAKANRFLYEFAPLLVFAGAFIPFAVLPFSRHLVIADMDLGLFYVIAFSALEVVGILMAGWGPNSKWSLYGGMRLAAQMLSYEIPLGLSVLVVVIMTGTLNLTGIIEWQTHGILGWEEAILIPIGGWAPLGFLSWSIFRSGAAFIAFWIFVVAAFAETKRAPFDLPEAESELVAGFHTEYTGIRFSYFFLAEYCAMYVMCVLGVVVFLGGWHWPLPVPDVDSPGFIAAISAGIGDVAYREVSFEFSFQFLRDAAANVMTFLGVILWSGPIETVRAIFSGASLRYIASEAFGFINLVGKAFVLMFVMLWVRWTLPRIRIDQVMYLCLKVLLPIGLFIIILAAVETAFVPKIRWLPVVVWAGVLAVVFAIGSIKIQVSNDE